MASVEDMAHLSLAFGNDWFFAAFYINLVDLRPEPHFVDITFEVNFVLVTVCPLSLSLCLPIKLKTLVGRADAAVGRNILRFRPTSATIISLGLESAFFVLCIKNVFLCLLLLSPLIVLLAALNQVVFVGLAD